MVVEPNSYNNMQSPVLEGKDQHIEVYSQYQIIVKRLRVVFELVKRVSLSILEG